MSRKSTTLKITEWELETLFELSNDSVSSKEELSNIVEGRETIRTSTRLPQSKINDIQLEEPEVIDNVLKKLKTCKENTSSVRVLKNSGSGTNDIK
ncbi:hypothetical protein MOSE0_D03620 [Monosporozyma servazzii]